MKKTYLIVGDNNFWYSTVEAENIQEIHDHLKYVREELLGEIDDVNLRTPNKLYVYEAKEILVTNC